VLNTLEMLIPALALAAALPVFTVSVMGSPRASSWWALLWLVVLVASAATGVVRPGRTASPQSIPGGLGQPVGTG
jgi:hypothetical protein